MMEPKDMENDELGTNSHKLELREVAYTAVQQVGLAHMSCGISDFSWTSVCCVHLILHLLKHEDLLQLSTSCLAMISASVKRSFIS